MVPVYITKNINLHRSHNFAKFTLKNCRAVQKQVVDDLRNIIKKLKEEEEEKEGDKKTQKPYETIWYSTTNKHDFVSEYCQGSHIKTSVFRSKSSQLNVVQQRRLHVASVHWMLQNLH